MLVLRLIGLFVLLVLLGLFVLLVLLPLLPGLLLFGHLFFGFLYEIRM